MILTCEKCGGDIVKSKTTKKNITLQLLGVLCLFSGIGIALAIFPMGLIPALFLILISFTLGYKRQKIWVCKNCGYFFERVDIC